MHTGCYCHEGDHDQKDTARTHSKCQLGSIIIKTREPATDQLATNTNDRFYNAQDACSRYVAAAA